MCLPVSATSQATVSAMTSGSTVSMFAALAMSRPPSLPPVMSASHLRVNSLSIMGVRTPAG